MKILNAILIILFLFTGSAISQIQKADNEEFYTYGYSNGKLWETFNKQEKILVLMGTEEGIAFVSEWTENNKPYEELSIQGFRMSDIVSEVDLFYSQRANIRVTVVAAYSYVIKKMKGATVKELDEYAASLRKKYNK